MTTIATDGMSLAGDGRATRGDVISGGDRKKVHRLPDGSIIGVAGRTRDAERVVRSLMNNPHKPEEVRGDYTVMRLYPGGELWVHEDTLTAPMQMKPPFAIGSGWVAALGALMAGADSRQAVKIASKLDVHTGGKITSYSL